LSSGGWGRLVYRFRWAIVVLSVLPLVPAIWLVLRGGDLDTSVVPITTESGRAAELPSFRQDVVRALDPLRRDPRVARVTTAYDRSPPNPMLLSRDGHRTRAAELVGRASPFESLEFSSVPPDVYRSLRRLPGS
jgi:hypothetical protein